MAGSASGGGRWTRAPGTDNVQPGDRTRHTPRGAHFAVIVESVHAAIYSGLEATGVYAPLVGAHRQLRGRLRHLLQRPGRAGHGRDAGDDGGAEVEGERRQDTLVSSTARAV